jgi:hypothetical protein
MHMLKPRFFSAFALVFLRSFPIGSSLADCNWAALEPEDGVVRALAIDPVTTRVVYLGTMNQGLMKSINGGASCRDIAATGLL